MIRGTLTLALVVVLTAAATAGAAVTSIGIHHHTQGPQKVTSPGDVIFVQAAPFLPRPVCRAKVRWSLKDGAGRTHRLRRFRPRYTHDWLTGRVYDSVGRVPQDAAPGMGRLKAKQRCPDIAKTSGSIKMRITDPDAPPARITDVRAPDMVAGEGGEIRFTLNLISRVEATLEYELVPGRWEEVGSFFKRQYYKEGGTKTIEWGGRVSGELPPAGHYRVMVRPRDLSIGSDAAGPPAYGEFHLARAIGEDALGDPVDLQQSPDGRLVLADRDGSALRAIEAGDVLGGPFGGGLSSPLDIAFGEGAVFVATSQGVVRVAADGATSTLASSASFGRSGPSGIAADASRLYVADGDEVEVVDFAGRPQGQIADDLMTLPRSVAVAPDGTIWVADPGSEQLFQFSADGRRLVVLADSRTALARDATVGRPRGVDVDRGGRVLWTDSEGAVVRVRSGESLLTFGAGLLGDPGGILYADGIAAAGLAGDIYVADRGHDRVLHFRAPR